MVIELFFVMGLTWIAEIVRNLNDHNFKDQNPHNFHNFKHFFFLFTVFGPVPEFIDPVFAKTSQNARFLLSENERFGLVFVKTGSLNSGTGLIDSGSGSRFFVTKNSDYLDKKYAVCLFLGLNERLKSPG